MKLKRRIIIPEVLNIISDTTKIHYFSFAEDFSGQLFNKFGKLNIKFRIKSNKYFKSLKKKNCILFYSDEIKVHNFDKKSHTFSLLWEKRIKPFGNLYAHCVIKPDNIILEVSKFYYNFVKFKIENLIPPGLLLKDLTYLLLILNDFLPVHSSSFAINRKQGFLILAPPNVGKSYTVMQAVKEGYHFLSEDISIVNKRGKIFPVAYTSTYTHEISKLKYLSLFSYYLPAKVEPMGKKFKKELLNYSTINKIFLLEPSKKKGINYLKKASNYLLDRERIVARILTLHKDEFNILNDRVILTYFYATGLINKFNKLEKELITNMVNGAEDIILIRSKEPAYFYKVIKEIIRYGKDVR